MKRSIGSSSHSMCIVVRPLGRCRFRSVVLGVALLVGVADPCCCSLLAQSEPLQEARFDRPVELAKLEKDAITESSGLAPSHVSPNVFWTHNDSGDEPRVFAFDRQGQHLGTSHFLGAQAKDWEDMGSFRLNGRSYLFVADVGDNRGKRESYSIYIAREPENPKRDTRAIAIDFQYSDGSHNCEAVAYDGTTGAFLLVEKAVRLRSRVYQLQWPARNNANERMRTATLVGEVSVPIATAADVSADGLNLVVATYGKGYFVRRRPNESWQAALNRPGHTIALPPRRQGESICFDAAGENLYLTSEKRPCPLFEMKRISEN